MVTPSKPAERSRYKTPSGLSIVSRNARAKEFDVFLVRLQREFALGDVRRERVVVVVDQVEEGLFERGAHLWVHHDLERAGGRIDGGCGERLHGPDLHERVLGIGFHKIDWPMRTPIAPDASKSFLFGPVGVDVRSPPMSLPPLLKRSARRFREIFALVLLLLALGGCGHRNREQLVVGMELAYPPFEMTDEHNQPSGIGVELAQALASALHKELVIENTQFTGLIPALKTGKIDLIISSMTATAERAESIDFSDPYMKTGICLLVGANTGIQSVEDLNKPGRRVVVKSGTTGFAYARDHLTQAELLPIGEKAACALEVSEGKADAFIYDQMSSLPIASAIRPDDPRAAHAVPEGKLGHRHPQRRRCAAQAGERFSWRLQSEAWPGGIGREIPQGRQGSVQGNGVPVFVLSGGHDDHGFHAPVFEQGGKLRPVSARLPA